MFIEKKRGKNMFSKSNISQVIPQTFSAPNSNLRGYRHGLNPKIVDFAPKLRFFARGFMCAFRAPGVAQRRNHSRTDIRKFWCYVWALHYSLYRMEDSTSKLDNFFAIWSWKLRLQIRGFQRGYFLFVFSRFFGT